MRKGRSRFVRAELDPTDPLNDALYRAEAKAARTVDQVYRDGKLCQS
jgi:hypothetical protein